MTASSSTSPMVWSAAEGAPSGPRFTPDELSTWEFPIREQLHLVSDRDGRIGAAFGGRIDPVSEAPQGAFDWLGSLPPVFPEWLGDRSFLSTHQVRFPYVAGAMANGIATAELVIAMARAQMLGFFGAGGLALETVRANIEAIAAALPNGESWGANLIHSPNEPDLEDAVVDLYLEKGVRRVSASAYMKMTPTIVRYACTGLYRTSDGAIARSNRIFAKISRVEVAEQFMSPAPAAILEALVAAGKLTAEEATLAALIPVAEDIIAEADSGGHTDNRTLTALLPDILNLRGALQEKYAYAVSPRIGAAGGIGTPTAVAAAFGLGAAFVLTGSVNQAAIESGLSDEGKLLLAQVDAADVCMAPAPDMFELGVEVQVIRRGSLFAQRARQLYELYREHNAIEEIPAKTLATLEKRVFQRTVAEIWEETSQFWAQRAPEELARAAKDSKHKMALIFRWYVGKSSRWAIAGTPKRQLDYQIWCGPAMGAFNSWTQGSFLENPEARDVVQIALNLLEGAATVSRAQQLRSMGIPIPQTSFDFRPRPLR